MEQMIERLQSQLELMTKEIQRLGNELEATKIMTALSTCKEYLTVSEAAAYIGKKPSYILARIRNRDLHFCCPEEDSDARDQWISKKDLEAFIRRYEFKSKQEIAAEAATRVRKMVER